MAYYTIRLRVEGTRHSAVEKLARATFGDSLIQVSKVDLSRSRADRLADIENTLQDCANDVEELGGELQEWRDSIPENLQDGEKASDLDEAISALESLKDDIEGVDFSNVSFPSMM